MVLEFGNPVWLWGLSLVPAVWLLSLRGRVRPSRRLRLASIALRSSVVIAFVLALADPACRIPGVEYAASTCVIVTDRSLSVQNSREDIEHHREAFGAVMKPLGSLRFIDFAADAWVAGEAHTPSWDGTRIEAGLDRAVAELAAEDSGCVVLFTDGRSTAGDPVGAAMRLQRRGCPVYVVGIGQPGTAGARIVGVEPPSILRIGQPSRMLVRIRNDLGSSFGLQLLSDDHLQVDHLRGHDAKDAVYALRFVPNAQGWQDYTVMITGTRSDDPSPRETIASVPVFVEGPPRILLIATVPEESSYLAQCLTDNGLQVDTLDLAEADRLHDQFGRYDTVVVSDCAQLDDTFQSNMVHHIRESGMGLVFIGGASVQTASWHDSPLEELLPVTFLPEKVTALYEPRPVHVCFVLDKSGSMEAPLGPTVAGLVTKLDMVKAAVHQSVTELPPEATVSVIAFDGQPHVVVDSIAAANWSQSAGRLDRVPADGGTIMDSAIEKGIELVQSEEQRHIILLTDGHAQTSTPGGERARWRDLAEQMLQANISLTTVALGQDADRALLEYLALTAGGAGYSCNDASEVPTIFVQEAQAIKETARQARPPFRPQAGPAAARLKGMSIASLPNLDDAIAASPKQFGQVILETDEDLPLLAAWKQGPATVACFLSDAKADWAHRWIIWRRFNQFWQQVISWALRPANKVQAQVKADVNGTQVRMLVRAEDDDGRAIQGLRGSGVLGPHAGQEQGPDIPLQWHEVRPGVYEGMSVLSEPGRYTCRLQLHDSEECVFTHNMVIDSMGSTESSEVGPDYVSLGAIAEAGGGKLNPSPAEVAALTRERLMEHVIPARPWRLWPWFVLGATLLWTVDVTLRRISSRP